MLDSSVVRNTFEVVAIKLAQRGFPTALLLRFHDLDERRRALIRKRDDLNARRNAESQEIGKLMKAGQKEEAESRRAAVRQLGEQIATIESELSAVENDLNELMTALPNLPSDSVPVGADESANQEVKRWGTPPAFSFE